MFGEIGAWFFKGLGGIFPDADQPGFKHIILRPHFEKDLEKFKAEFESPFGIIVSEWNWDKNIVIYKVVIPSNSSATFFIPENVEVQGVNTKGFDFINLDAGNYTFNISYQ